MELHERIKKLRNEKGWSQEMLAERAYVSRQTVSNWETDKCYPDVRSLIILADIFGVSLDELIKGDVDTMKETITKNDGKMLKKLEYLALFEMLVLMFGVTLLVDWGGEIGRLIGLFLAGALTAAIFMTFHKMEQIKKDNDVQTYREVIAFMKGESLDDIEKAKELEKRGAEKKKILIFLICYVLSGAILALICHYLL
ncbi:DNA-binding transcriptional regulator, XRE-family HTH domain [Ruminococcus flavefaciens]|uniref:DNA-binding transcriptional regulator, XRE-family HTH domain n=1 Tax=Ruminococcus flavefaciens TaxID=1265 RepID=A0A1H6I3U9_RUMFL|nr:helix-turn-helix transcriptional regulator [Ruminococcus flavefaciens]SEH40959.1 DNA-binding transcriptional regulator, XRE-family HTH domain [Ruminococcus flavefaciens]